MQNPVASCVIIDDEINGTEVLAYEIGRIAKNVQVLKAFNDPNAAVNFLKEQEVDIVFLDVEMPRLNGFELLEQLPDLSASVIFVTAYDAYAIKAFKYMAVDYLLKPIERNDLSSAIDRALERKRSPERKLIKQIQHSLQSPNTILNKVALPNANGYIMLDISNIMYCRAESNYSKIHLESTKTHLISKPLKYLDELLADQGFFRVHQSWLINAKHIVSYSRNDGGKLEMLDGKIIPVSKSRKAYIEALLEQLRS